ncbi:hypothetical protein [Acidithiobacillus thiooxidans]|uniref:DUF4276 family protein n=1 Tax=Acidithiobacillus thiooxidans ATCC 19377 TaxID=637390 RepID=A0A543Q6L9_ACITH|nr:hypothetical protein [Acidithiobacillus thiooxidans]MDX5933823.1 hypothetical protein [Acidithiobacillus thiooxidans]TQN51960.1 hypothetical protein DLNHIDIE_01841 [Acidithiobacillus thiooxidans ATCC 19377]
MNIYLVVEGEKTETLVYNKWIGYTNNSLRVVRSISDVSVNNVYMIVGNGWPCYLDRIKAAVEDVCTKTDAHGLQLFSRLVVAVDTETVTVEEKTAEITKTVTEALNGSHMAFDLHVVAQHFCIEAWFLGNKNLVLHTQLALSKEDIKNYNVSKLDPELLCVPSNSSVGSKAQYAEKYLARLIKDKFPKSSYSKNDPGPILHEKYYKSIVSRFNNAGHIQSFGSFIKAFT